MRKHSRKKRKRRSYELRRLRRLYWKKPRHKLYTPYISSKSYFSNGKEYHIKAPVDFRLLENTQECVRFFRLLKSQKKAVSIPNGKNFQRIDLKKVKHIDFSSTMVLGAIIDEMRDNAPVCYCSGRLPDSSKCSAYIRQSGFLDTRYNGHGVPYGQSFGSKSLRIERGQTKLDVQKVFSIVSIIKLTKDHLKVASTTRHYRQMDVIKEICGNAFGWSRAINRQWTLGAKFDKDKVTFVVLDLGVGILDSLARDYWDVLKDLFMNHSEKQILEGAFLRKYKSASEDNNRNRGLPSIKKAFNDGCVEQLNVLANNVCLDFVNSKKSKKFASNKNKAFDGTLYSWVLTADSFK